VQRILVVDDDLAIRDVVAEILQMSNYEVEKASNGAEALTVIRRQPPAAVLLDLMMPVMDGWEFLRHCRRAPPCAPVPVAIMSAARNASAQAVELGAQAFLQKPFEFDAIVETVERLVPVDNLSG
jgi:CheY-like chemotaxis protein